MIIQAETIQSPIVKEYKKMTILEALEKWLATIAPGQDASHNLEALNKASKALGGPGDFKSVGPAWDDVLSRWQGGGGGDYTPYTGEYEVTPSTADQTLETAGKGLDEDVTVKAVTSAIDENIQPGNIKKDVQILGVTGTLEESEEVPEYEGSYSVTPDTAPQTLLTQGKKMTQNLEVKAITPQHTYNDIELSYRSSLSDVEPAFRITKDKPGCIVDKNVPEDGWYTRYNGIIAGGSNVIGLSLADIENLISGNIKSGVTLLGVAGSYAPESRNVMQPIALSRIGGVDNAQLAAFFNGKHYLFGVDSAFYSMDGVTFQRDTAYDTAYSATTTSTTERYNKAIHGAFVLGDALIAVVGFTTAEDAPYNHMVQFLYTSDGVTWNAGEVIVNQAVAAGDVEDVAAGVSASHLIVYYRHNTEAKGYYFVSADVSPLEFTFAQMTAGITASSGSEYAEEGTVKICRWDNSGDVLLTWQNDSNAWYFGKVSIAANDVSSEPVPTKAFTPEQVTCLQYIEDSNVGVGLSTGSWIALTALEEESQPGTATPIFTGSSVLALAFGGEGNGIAGGIGGNMAFCSAGAAWKVFAPINGGSNLVSAAYGGDAFVMAGEGTEASVSTQA